jgi:putative membrane protein
MPNFKVFFRQLHWKILLIRILVNSVALTFTVMIIPDIYFITPTFQIVIILSIGLGILNAIVKPVILLLTGQLIFVTYGLLVILVNALLLYLLERFFPDFLAVNGLLWALVGGAVLGLVSNALENLLGLTPPIVPEENLELRKQIEAKQSPPLASLVAKPQTVVRDDVETQSVSELTAAKAALDILTVASGPDTDLLPDHENLPGQAESNLLASDSPKTQERETLSGDASDPNSGGAA